MLESYFCHRFDLQSDIISKKDKLSMIHSPPGKESIFKDVVFGSW